MFRLSWIILSWVLIISGLIWSIFTDEKIAVMFLIFWICTEAMGREMKKYRKELKRDMRKTENSRTRE